jgi:hypothetical protein
MSEDTQVQSAKERQIAGLRPFKKGESGNPGGRPKGRGLTSYLREFAEADNDAAKKDIALKILDKAKAGDPKFVEMVWERLDGKVPDKVENDTLMRVLVEYVDGQRDQDPASEPAQEPEAGQD